jgi:hypothetical protein
MQIRHEVLPIWACRNIVHAGVRAHVQFGIYANLGVQKYRPCGCADTRQCRSVRQLCQFGRAEISSMRMCGHTSMQISWIIMPIWACRNIVHAGVRTHVNADQFDNYANLGVQKYRPCGCADTRRCRSVRQLCQFGRAFKSVDDHRVEAVGTAMRERV